MAYSLRGDRNIEYKFATDNIPGIYDTISSITRYSPRALDVGPGPRCTLGKWAMNEGWSVCAVDAFEEMTIPGIEWIKADLNLLSFAEGYFDLIINVSSIEHFGIPGRYGVKTLDEDADIRAMRKMRGWLSDEGVMVVTLPVGDDTYIFAPYHRVYGRERLLDLFSGYKVKVQKFWNKKGKDDIFVPCSDDDALSTEPTLDPHHYYAIGGFVLTKDTT